MLVIGTWSIQRFGCIEQFEKDGNPELANMLLSFLAIQQRLDYRSYHREINVERETEQWRRLGYYPSQYSYLFDELNPESDLGD